MPDDPTESTRRQLVSEINAAPGTREALEKTHSEVLDTTQLSLAYDVLGFMAPYVVVRRKSDGVKGSLTFQHSPRIYFDFVAD